MLIPVCCWDVCGWILDSIVANLAHWYRAINIWSFVPRSLSLHWRNHILLIRPSVSITMLWFPKNVSSGQVQVSVLVFICLKSISSGLKKRLLLKATSNETIDIKLVSFIENGYSLKCFWKVPKTVLDSTVSRLYTYLLLPLKNQVNHGVPRWSSACQFPHRLDP